MALACAASIAAAAANIGPNARELLDINKKMAEPTCDRTKIVLERAIAREKGDTARAEELRLELKKIDDDPRIVALTERGRELSKQRFNADEKEALSFQMGTIQKACPWLRPAPKVAPPGGK